MNIAPFKLERFFAKYEFNAKYLLCSSDCESMSIKELISLDPMGEKKLLDCHLGYTESTGNPVLKEAISKIYTSMDSSNIFVHAGAEEAVFNLMNAHLKPLDHVIVHSPCYQSHVEIARAIGCSVTEIFTEEKHNWKLFPEAVIAAITSETKLIILCSPHNPTGYVIPESDMRLILNAADKIGALVLCDEVYRELEHGMQTQKALCDMHPLQVSLGVMSKAYGLAGLRIGWLASKNMQLLQKVAAFKDYNSICSSAPSEVLSIIALNNRAHLLKRNLDIINTNLNIADSFFARHKDLFRWQRPKASSVAFVGYNGNEGVENFCADLVNEAGLLLAPGSLFAKCYDNFRLGYGRANFLEALKVLEEWLEKR